MKKPLKKRIKKWKIGDYARQFSIVTGGDLLTLWLTARITEAAKQREVRQAMQLVASELHDNLQVVRDYKYTYSKDKWVARRLLEADFSLAGFPSDTVETYSRYITGGMGKPYRLSSDALEMLKTTGIASHIADKQTLIDLLRCYKELAAFDDYMQLLLLPAHPGHATLPDGESPLEFILPRRIRENARRQNGTKLDRGDPQGLRRLVFRRHDGGTYETN